MVKQKSSEYRIFFIAHSFDQEGKKQYLHFFYFFVLYTCVSLQLYYCFNIINIHRTKKELRHLTIFVYLFRTWNVVQEYEGLVTRFREAKYHCKRLLISMIFFNFLGFSSWKCWIFFKYSFCFASHVIPWSYNI